MPITESGAYLPITSGGWILYVVGLETKTWEMHRLAVICVLGLRSGLQEAKVCCGGFGFGHVWSRSRLCRVWGCGPSNSRA